MGKCKKLRLGSGKRFENLSEELEEKGIDDPEALAAWIGRRKYGKRRFQEMSTRGRRRQLRISERRGRLPK